MVALATAGCGGDDTAGAQRTGIQRTPAEVLEAILERCHGARRNTFARSVVELRAAEDGPADALSLELPDRLRIDRADGHRAVLDGESGLSWSAAGTPARPADDELGRLRTLRAALGALFLMPLENAREPERTSPGVIVFRTDSADRWQLGFDPDTLTPTHLGRLGSEPLVEFIAHYDSGVTRIPSIARIAPLGARHVRVVETDFRFEPATFAPPGTPMTPGPTVASDPGGHVFPIARPRGHRPELKTIPACKWVLVEDPGSWSSRFRALYSLGGELIDQGWQNGGDPFLIELEDRAWMGFPIVAAPDLETRALESRDDRRIVDRPAHRAAVVEASPGPFEKRLAQGRSGLERFIAARGLESAGPVRAVFYPILEGSPELLKDLPDDWDVHLELPVKD